MPSPEVIFFLTYITLDSFELLCNHTVYMVAYGFFQSASVSLCVSVVHSFLLLYSIPLYEYTTACLFCYCGNLSCFQFGAIMNKSAMNILFQVVTWIYVLSLWGKYLGVKSLGQRVVGIYLTLLETAKKFSKVVVPFYITTA